jgi:hypothetical protein
MIQNDGPGWHITEKRSLVGRTVEWEVPGQLILSRRTALFRRTGSSVRSMASIPWPPHSDNFANAAAEALGCAALITTHGTPRAILRSSAAAGVCPCTGNPKSRETSNQNCSHAGQSRIG